MEVNTNRVIQVTWIWMFALFSLLTSVAGMGILWNKTQLNKNNKESIHRQYSVYTTLALPKGQVEKIEREYHDIYAAHGDICVQERGKPRSEVCTAIVDKCPHGVAWTITRICHELFFLCAKFYRKYSTKEQIPKWRKCPPVCKISLVPVIKIRSMLQQYLSKNCLGKV